MVVCRPRPSARRSPVAISSSPARALTSDDLPTPDEPSAATVRPRAKYAPSSSTPSPVEVADGVHRTPIATASTSTSAASTSSHRSALVRTTTGSAPLSHPEREVALEPARRSGRRRARREEHGVDVRGDDLLDRLAVVVRRHPRKLRAARQDGVHAGRRGATQSPTAGSSPRSSAAWRSRPASSAVLLPARV